MVHAGVSSRVLGFILCDWAWYSNCRDIFLIDKFSYDSVYFFYFFCVLKSYYYFFNLKSNSKQCMRQCCWSKPNSSDIFLIDKSSLFEIARPPAQRAWRPGSKHPRVRLIFRVTKYQIPVYIVHLSVPSDAAMAATSCSSPLRTDASSSSFSFSFRHILRRSSPSTVRFSVTDGASTACSRRISCQSSASAPPVMPSLDGDGRDDRFITKSFHFSFCALICSIRALMILMLQLHLKNLSLRIERFLIESRLGFWRFWCLVFFRIRSSFFSIWDPCLCTATGIFFYFLCV